MEAFWRVVVGRKEVVEQGMDMVYVQSVISGCTEHLVEYSAYSFWSYKDSVSLFYQETQS